MLVQCAMDMVSPHSIQTILDVISGKKNNFDYELINLKNYNFNEIVGEIVGGCVSVIAGNFATRNQIDWHQKILFLEDEGEDGERLDRYFQQIATIIKENHFKPLAIILGNFMQGNNHGTPKANNIKIAIEKFIKKYTKRCSFFLPLRSNSSYQSIQTRAHALILNSVYAL